MKSILLILSCLVCSASIAQVINTATMDSTDYQFKGKLTVEGYLDTYYAYNFNKPQSKDQPYFVSMARHNEININLAFVDLKYTSSRVRARIAPGFGTYMNANYSNEQSTLKNFVEANAGYRLLKNKTIWIDAGIIGSPYTNESAISKDQLAYTRSLAAENVPYYLSGIKLTVPLSKQVNGYFYVVNGWQQINDQNSNKSIGTQLEWRPNNSLLLNWNTFIGNERSAIDSAKGLRTFTDLFFIYNKSRWSVTGCAYYGRQRSPEGSRMWWQANLVAQYGLNATTSVTARVEYFNDEDGVVVVPLNSLNKFETMGASLGINVKLDSNLLFRAEARRLFSNENVYQKGDSPTNQSISLTTSVCIWF